MAELITGITGRAEDEVTEIRTAAYMGSGGLRVYATPRMTAMMEYTAWSSVEPYMEEGMGTVGTRLEVSHLAASPVFKGIPNFRETRIKMLRAEKADELLAILEQCRELLRER